MVKAAWVDKNGLRKGAWSDEEDQKLRAYILKYGHWNWRLLPKFAGLDRCGKSCRLRWVNYLKPGVKRGNFTREEADLIKKLHDELGSKWSAIAKKLPGRTDNEIKNYWHAHLNKSRKISKSDIRWKQQSSETAHCKDLKKNSEKLPSPEEETSSDKHILESSSSSNSGISGAVNWDLDLSVEENWCEMPSGSSNSLPFNSGVNDNYFSSSDPFLGFQENFWMEPFTVDASYSREFHFSLLDDSGPFSTHFSGLDDKVVSLF